jgi:cytochrome c-type biogenesis protein CcmE
MPDKKLSLLILASFTAIAFIALYHNISPYHTPSELIKLPQAKNIQVVGKIAAINGNSFQLTDEKNSITVIYSGTVDYYEGDIVVVGDWDGKLFHAKELYQKCHTEYRGG